jgi:carbonic anhydrase
MQVEQLKNLEPVLSKSVTNNKVKIVGAVYHLESGKVEFLPENYLSSLNK